MWSSTSRAATRRCLKTTLTTTRLGGFWPRAMRMWSPWPTYTGRYRDLVTGLQYNRARWYDAHTGRWLSEDPIGFEAGDGNLYRYAGNELLWQADPLGLWTQITKTIYEAEGAEDSLMGLAWEITGNNDDWTCVWPVKWTRQYWTNYPWAEKCARADISNLFGEDAVSFGIAPKTTQRDDYMH